MWREDAPVQLTPKQFDLLFYFVENSGRAAKKSELLDAVWADTYIEETTLARNVSWLRKKLGECTNGESFIETVPKLGYRFTAEVTQPEDNENLLIIEEQIIQHFRGEETITFDDEELTKSEIADRAQIEKFENKEIALPNKSFFSRRTSSAFTPLFVLLALVIFAGSGFILYRNQITTNEVPIGLNVKATITVKNITVDAARETVDTGLKVQPGDTIKVSAMGIHQPETGQIWTFAGDKTGKVFANHTFQNADPWSLVAWIGSETDKADYFQVSKNHTVIAERSGSLYLAVNDLINNYADNRGGINVAVVLYRTYGISADNNDLESAWGSELVEIHKEDTLAVRGRGNVSYWQGGELYDLDGSDHDTTGHLAQEINARSLIGKIGSRNPFKVGMNFPEQKMTVNGGLFISVNDRIMDKPDAFNNNSGEITVDVEVVRQTESFKNPI